MKRVPGFAAGKAELHTSITWRPAGSMVTTTSASFTASTAEEATLMPLLLGGVAKKGNEVEGSDPVTGLHQVLRHGRTHITEADEGYRGHGAFLPIIAVDFMRESIGRNAFSRKPRASFSRAGRGCFVATRFRRLPGREIDQRTRAHGARLRACALARPAQTFAALAADRVRPSAKRVRN